MKHIISISPKLTVKKVLCALLGVFFIETIYAQDHVFNSEYDKLVFPISLNVGGGITGDDHYYKKLTLYHGNAIVFQTGTNQPDYNYNRMIIAPDGKVGIGTQSPGDQLTVQDAIRVSTSNGGGGFFAADASTGGNSIFSFTRQGGNNLSLSAWDGIGFASAARSGPSSTYQMFIHPNGNVGINTKAPDAQLAVNGTIHSREVKVDLNFPPPDYVFEKSYPLMPLAALSKYLKANSHLPGVPSAYQLEKDGINLSEMNMKLLQKVEELTLYLIEKDKEGNLQKKAIQKLEKQVSAQKVQLNKLFKSKH